MVWAVITIYESIDLSNYLGKCKEGRAGRCLSEFEVVIKYRWERYKFSPVA